MANDIGPRIRIEGEKEYKQALNEIISAQKVMGSELELVSAKFSGQENTVEALTAKHDVLQRKMYTEQEKVEALRGALQHAAETYGESDKRTQNWQVQLNKAEAQLTKTKKEVDNTETQVKELAKAEKDGTAAGKDYGEAHRETTEKMTGLGDVLEKVTKKIGIDMPQSLTTAINGLGGIDAKTLAFAGTAGALVTALVTVEKKLAAMTKEAAAFADEIITTSAVTGISTERLQAYAYAADLVDVSVDTLTGAQTLLISAMNKASEGSAAQVEAFKKLSVRIYDTNGDLRNSEDVMWAVIDALGQIDNETERDAAAMALMGKSARELNPIIKAGSGVMKEYADEAESVGYILSNDQLAALGKVDDAFQRLTRAVEGGKNQLAAQFAPALSDSTDKATGFITKVMGAAKETKIVESFGSLLSTVSDLLDPIGDLIEWGAPGLAKAFDVIGDSIAIVIDAVRILVGMLQMLSIVNWSKGVDNVMTGMGWNVSNGKLSAQQQRYYKSALETSVYDPTIGGWVGNGGRNAAGDPNWRGGVTWVGENGPELVYLPQGSQIMSASESREYGDTTIYVTIDAKNVREFNDIIEMAQNARINSRKRGAIYG